jgi:hypothetical protein
MVAELELLPRQSLGLRAITEYDQRLGGLSTPAAKHWMADADLGGPDRRHPSVGQRILGPVLRKPQPRAALQ